jgi:hypothetical protein
MLNTFLLSYSSDKHISEMTNNYKSNFHIKDDQKFNSYFVQKRLCLHHENKAVPDVYERNLISFLKITRDHTTLVGIKVSATRNQSVGVTLGTQDLSACGDSRLTCFRTEVLTAGNSCFQKFRHTA